MNNPATLARLIDLAMEMEKKAYAFYTALEKRFADNGEFVRCLVDVKEDELMHQRVLDEIRRSLPDYRLEAPVSPESVERLAEVLRFLEENDPTGFTSTEEAFDAIGILEEVEFDVVMEFVNIDEIDFAFSRDYLHNESLAHANRITRARQCLE